MIRPQALSASSTIINDLDWPFDFSPTRADDNTDWIRLNRPTEHEIIAGDGAGGVFLVYGQGALEKLPILHATSEGQAGRIASNLTEWLSVLMAIPYWRDLLKFSGGGKLTEMRRTAKFMEREYEADLPELTDARERLKAALRIPASDDPIKTLYRNVKATDYTLVADDGTEWESLFNTFVANDNPKWKRK